MGDFLYKIVDLISAYDLLPQFRPSSLSRRLSPYRCGVIYLTRSWGLPPLNFADQNAQLHQIIGPEPRAASGRLCKWVFGQVRPRLQYRAQATLDIEEHHA